MLKIFKTENNVTTEIAEFSNGVWIHMINPSPEELATVRLHYNIDEDHLKAALDDEESPRIDVEDESTLFIIDIPIPFEDKVKKGARAYGTIPLGIVVAENAIVTVCTMDLKLLNDFIKIRIKGFDSSKKTRMILQIMYKSATYFLFYLKQIDRISETTSGDLSESMKNEALMQLLSLEKSLVYFTTSLKANEVVFEKMLRLDSVKKYEEDRDLLDDVIIENKQAIEMAGIYTGILNGTMNVVGSIISNNLNIVMKILTSITIIMAIPTITSGFMGMNVPVPWQDNTLGFIYVITGTIILACIAAVIMIKKKLF